MFHPNIKCSGGSLVEVSRALGSCGFTYARKAVSGSILALRRRPEVHTLLREYKPELSRGVSRDWGRLVARIKFPGGRRERPSLLTVANFYSVLFVPIMILVKVI